MLPVIHGEVGDAHDGRRPLGMLGHAQPVVDRPVAARGVKPGGGAQLFGRNAGDISVISGEWRTSETNSAYSSNSVPVASDP